MTTELGEVSFTPVDQALERLEHAVSPLVGIVTHVVRTTHANDDSRLVHTACQAASAVRAVGQGVPDYSGGAHVDRNRSRVAAIGEAVERYCGSFVPEEQIVHATARELGHEAVPPERFALFHPHQLSASGFPFAPFTADTALRFVRGISLPHGRPVFLPAQLVFLAPATADETAIGYATSNGLAAGPTFEEAVLAALLELVERDAVMLAWKNRLSLPLLDWSGDEAIELVERCCFAPTRLRYSVLDGSRFLGVPVAIGIVRGPAGEQTALALGGGAAATVAEAWLKALSEAFSVYRWLGRETLRVPDRTPPKPEAVRTFDDHMLFYARHEQARLASFLYASEERTATDAVGQLPGRTPREQIAQLASRLEARGVSAYAVDVTTPEIRRLGLRVARVVAPELCGLDVVHLARFLGGPRLYHAAYEAGLADRPLTVDDLNSLPHPFP